MLDKVVSTAKVVMGEEAAGNAKDLMQSRMHRYRMNQAGQRRVKRQGSGDTEEAEVEKVDVVSKPDFEKS